ncbi:peptidase family M1, partial [Ostertagia ostertagi]
EANTDVGGVVWDSALVAAHYFIKNSKKYRDKKCAYLAAIGADVIVTDLPSRVPLLKTNYEANKSVCRGSVSIEPLDWAFPGRVPDVDVLVLVDCIYYLESSFNAEEILCVYEKRDIGEPVRAQKVFLEKIAQYYEIVPVHESDLHPDFSCCDEIPVIKFIRKYPMLGTMYRDPTTSSNYDEITVTHYFLEWTVCFLQKNIYGCIEMTLKALKDVLDGDKLAISSVNLNGQDLVFTVEPGTPIGDKIVIKSPIKKDQEVKLAITYSTAQEAAALQFMDKELTADKKASYLFSQCQAIHARSIMPCMDTPSVKSSYRAEVAVPGDLVCLMSAICKGKKKTGDTTTYTFEQPVAIPSYLLAIVVGHIERREISPRCKSWLGTSLSLMRQDGSMISLCYLPTFPFGGMENPCLTFITPTLLCGDRSQVRVVAHEIAHSWTGNLVTNASWEHFWLNEGFTVFLERKIKGRLEGELERQFESECGYD